MGRDRFVAIEWGDKRQPRMHEFGFCDNGFRLATREEAELYQQLKTEGYEVRKHGWPDFLATRGTEVRLIEVKSSADKGLTSSQQVNIEALRQLGVPVEVITLVNPNRPDRRRRLSTRVL